MPAYGPGAPPSDAKATRRSHFDRLIRRPVTISLGLTGAIVAFAVAASLAGPLAGVAGALVATLLTGGIVFGMASNKAEHDFFEAYATARRLLWMEKGSLPALTPLLKKGDRRKAEHVMEGTLPGGIEGTVALYTYEEDSTDAEGKHQTSTYRFTVVTTLVPESAAHIPQLYCERRSGARLLDKVEDVFRSSKRVKLESAELDRRYEIFVKADQDDNWLRQLFSPTFIVWLAEQAPDDFGFELSGAFLCASVKGHRKNAVELDRLAEGAAAVAARLREEAIE